MKLSRWQIVMGVLAVVALTASCGASGDNGGEAAEDGGTTSSNVESPAATASFGSLDELCGDGDYSVEASQQGLANGSLNVGVATDRAAEFRPGLNKEVWDTSVAFAEWCNAQGGIGGLEINLVELSGALFNVEAAMTTACADVFAMVGGGFAQDNLEFSGKEGSDFHQCGMIDIPSFAASAEKSGSNGHVQPVPVTPDTDLNTSFRDYQKLFPEESRSAVIVWGEIPTMEATREKDRTVLEEVGIEVVGTVSYPMTGVTDWTPYAQKIIETGATTLTYVGEPANLASLMSRLRDQGWDGIAVLRSNMYDDQLFGAGDAAVEGTLVRLPAHPFEEAEQWPAVQQYLDLLEGSAPDAKRSLLGVQSMSAWLLFTVAANECAAAHDGVLDRTCILERAASKSGWDGSGLHAPQPIGSHEDVSPTTCSTLVVATAGGFERVYPEVGGDDDDGAGFHCPEDGLTVIEGMETGVVDPDRPI